MDSTTIANDGRSVRQIPSFAQFYHFWLVFLAFFTRKRETSLRIDTSQLDDDKTEEFRWHIRASDLKSRISFQIDVQKALNEFGLLFILIYTAESAWQIYCNLFERATHVHLTTGISRGAALFGVWLLLASQLGSALILSVRALFRRTGPMLPSMTLSLAAWTEAITFGDLTDPTTALGLTCISVAAGLLGLFRHDRHQRDIALQVPTDTRLLRVEEKVRGFCTATATGVVCPPMAVLCAYSALANAFWKARPLLVEYTRARHQLALGGASLVTLMAAQDRAGQKRVARVAWRLWDGMCVRVEKVMGWPRKFRPMGDKKHL